VDSYLGVVLVLSGLGGTALGGWLADRWTRRWAGAYFGLSGLGLFLSVPFLVLSLVTSQALFIFPCLLVGLTLAFLNIGPSNAILANVIRPRMRAAAVAVNLLCIRALGDIPAPWMMGRISDATGHLYWGIIIAAPALLLGGLFFCLGAPHLGPDQERVREGLEGERKKAEQAVS
ncbi:MAG TPA: hypothetical protein VKD72_35175, partial [Gemmataceae bacterium]|nr:hypothetical protein [Gemmataceae bacterium]